MGRADRRLDPEAQSLERTGIKVRCRPSLAQPVPDAPVPDPGHRPIQTLIDLATELEPLRLERAVNEADVRDLVDPETLRTRSTATSACPA